MSSSEERHEDIWEQSSVKDFFRKILTVQPNEEQKQILKEMIKEALKERDIGQ